MTYFVLFFGGMAGITLMALLGFVHGHGGSTEGVGHGHASLGHGHGALSHGHAPVAHGQLATHGHAAGSHAPAPSHGHGTVAHTHGGAHAAIGTVADWAKTAMFMAFSPLDVFSLAMGAGLAGIVLGSLLPASYLAFAAVAGALFFNFAVTKPLMRLFFAFAAKPSEGLEGMIAQTATAETNFDRSGKGLINLVLDGQTVRVLATLDSSDLKTGTRVAKGDTVLICEVDSKTNTCRVSRSMAG